MKTAYYNGLVYTGSLPLSQAFLVENGAFMQTGKNEAILVALSEGDRRVNLRGRFVCPGFNDSHMHLLGFGNMLRTAQLAAHSGSLAELTAYMRSYLAQHPPGEGQWLLGRGWNQDCFSDVRRMPDRYDLDAVSTAVPIMLTRACGHCCVLNSKALEILGIGPDTAAPEGGAIGFENGEPDGRLYDNAMERTQRALPVPGRKEIRDMLRAACQEANRYGVTSVQTDDYQVFPDVPWQTIRDVYEEMAESGELTVRVYEQAQLTKISELKRYIASGHATGAGSDLVKDGPLKLLGDGSLGSRTAYLSRPYADAPDTRGFSLYSQDRLSDMILYAHEHGMQVAVHAIGDACLDGVLNAIEQALHKAPRADHRHGVVHCQITRPEQLARIREMGLHVYAQTIFLDYDSHIVESRVGKALASTSYHWKALMDQGVSVSNGSDCPVELPNVMAGVACAVTRTALDGTGPYLPDQAFSVQEALNSFTIRGAEASFEENIKGKIAPGYLADFTLLSENPFETEPGRLHAIRAVGTFLGGKCVYAANE